jgi:5-methylcytosine-specific restriction endonuclease McrA
MEALVLVLNANYEPINVCNTRRALGLMLSGKAALIANGRGEIQTVSQSYPRPSVIRLEHMIQRPRPRIKLTRREVFRRDNYTCQYCARQVQNLTIDHVMPRHLGGLHTWTNVVAACPSCNHRKGGRRLDEAHLTLLQPPREPPASASYLYGRHIDENEEWVTFIKGW